MEQMSQLMEAGLLGSPPAEKLEVLRQVNALILDVDGVLFEGQQALPGAV